MDITNEHYKWTSKWTITMDIKNGHKRTLQMDTTNGHSECTLKMEIKN